MSLAGAQLCAERLAAIEQFLDANSRGNTDWHRYFRGYNDTAYSGPSFFRLAYCMELLAALAPRDARLLDIGSFGVELLALKHVRPDLKPRGIAWEGGIVTAEAEGFRHHHHAPNDGAVEVIEGDVERAPLPYPDASLDVVSAFETFEHFKFGPAAVMREIHRVLRPGGLLVVTTPNAASMVSIWKHCMGEHPSEHHAYFRNAEFGVVHPFEYMPADLRALIEGYGFELDAFETFFRERYGWMAEAMRAILNLMQHHIHARFDERLLGDKLLAVGRKAGPIVEPFPAVMFA